VNKKNLPFIALFAFLISGCNIPSSDSIPTISIDDSLPGSIPTYDARLDLKIVGVNDFHGAVLQDESYGNPGLAALAGALKAFDRDTTVLVNAGDSFQGSIESNYNHGELVSKCFAEIGFDAVTIGNHEFDWGSAYIAANGEFFGKPFLGANIYHYDMANHQTLDFASDIAGRYEIVEKGAFRIGIIGTIGDNQITSIASQFADDFVFIDPIPVIKSISDYLRNSQACDAIILSHHGRQTELLDQGLTAVSPDSGARYVDAVFCGHSHINESETENRVAFVQTSGYGTTLDEIDLTLTRNNGVVTVATSDYSTNVNSWGTSDPTVASIIQTYKAVSDEAGQEKLAQINANFVTRDQASNLYARAIYEAAKAVDPDILFAGGNNARSSFYATSANGKKYIAYADLYKGLPFDNQIIIGTVTGRDIIREIPYLYIYRESTSVKVEASKTYKVALLDYVATHRNANREYDYYPSFVQTDIIEDTYRDITAEYLRGQTGILDISEFDVSNPHFDPSLLN